MKEIKFRAWDKEKKEIYPDFQETYMVGDAITDNNEPRGEARYILMQFTGLKDKNGKEIYEGDRLVITDNSGNQDSGIVAYITERVAFGFYYHDGESNMIIDPSSADMLEITGNIYENPELLK